MSSPLKVGVIGLGNMGKHHVRNYNRMRRCKLVAVCDIDADVAASYAQNVGCSVFTDIETMLAQSDLDAVSIAVPTQSHFTVASTCIQAGVHCLIEKPVASSLEEAETLIKMAQSHNVTLMVGHIERFNPAVVKLKELIDDGVFGKVTCLNSKRVGAFPAQIKDCNVVIDLAIHDIDLFSYFLDQFPDKIVGSAGRALSAGREDYAQLFLNYGDQTGMIQVNWITPIRIRELSLTGANGYAELNYMTQELVVYESNYSSDFDTFGDYIIKFGSPNKKVIPVEKKEPLNLELEHFLECVASRRSPLVTGEMGYDALKVALEFVASIKSSSSSPFGNVPETAVAQ